MSEIFCFHFLLEPLRVSGFGGYWMNSISLKLEIRLFFVLGNKLWAFIWHPGRKVHNLIEISIGRYTQWVFLPWLIFMNNQIERGSSPSALSLLCLCLFNKSEKDKQSYKFVSWNFPTLKSVGIMNKHYGLGM